MTFVFFTSLNSVHVPFSIILAIKVDKRTFENISLPMNQCKCVIGLKQINNILLTRYLGSYVIVTFSVLQVLILSSLILLAGDIHPNPGPASTDSNVSSMSSVTSNRDFIDTSKHISFVHYNVQSIAPKLDLLYTELKEFDILAFTETWLNPQFPTEELNMQSFHQPERKDRADSYGGVILYIKEYIYYKRRTDLEINGVECIWVEIIICNKRILFGVLYRPPSTNAFQHNSLLD